jgi:preprotein translocase subunit YajC
MWPLWLIFSLVGCLVLVSGCAAPTEQQAAQGGWSSNIIMIVFVILIIAMMYFVMIRPQRKRAKERQEFATLLKRGDKVITGAGIYGEIESVTEDSAVLKLE